MRTARRWFSNSPQIENNDKDAFIFHVTVYFESFAFEDPEPTTIRLGNIWQGNTSSDFYVDWGDNTITTYAELSTTSSYLTHTYTNTNPDNHTKAYLIKIYATKLARVFYSGGITLPQLKVNVDGVSGSMPLYYDEDTSAAQSVHSPLFGLTSMIKFISKELFYRNLQITNFDYAFYASSQLTEIPEDLFIHHVDAVSFNQTFRSLAITSIPSKLFNNNTKVTSFTSTFSSCQNLLEIPETLFKYNTLVTTFDNVFSQCTKVTSIPANLFSTNTKVEIFRYSFYYTGILTIPNTLFRNNTAVAIFLGVFSDCSSLHTVPMDLFSSNNSVTNFSRSFFNNSNITSSVPTLWTRGNVTTYSSCFYNCISAANYTSIPSTWK